MLQLKCRECFFQTVYNSLSYAYAVCLTYHLLRVLVLHQCRSLLSTWSMCPLLLLTLLFDLYDSMHKYISKLWCAECLTSYHHIYV